MSVNPSRGQTQSWFSFAATWTLIGVILLATLALGLYGIHRSLWLDEAWVANSLRQPSLREMFRYSEWLQTSPPLFLLIARAFVQRFGLSIETLRSVPLTFAILAGILVWSAMRRMVAWPLAVFATSAMMFSPTAVEHFRSFKQYGGEIAATAATLLVAIRYLKSGKSRNLVWLCAVVGVLLTLSYPLIFLVPGLVGMVWNRAGRRQAAGLLSVAMLMEAGLYRWFIRPNLAPDLWTFWSAGWREVFSPSIVIAGVFCVVVGMRIAPRLLDIIKCKSPQDACKSPQDARLWMQVVCLLPCGLFFIAEAAGLYPTDPRMHLFLWPCVLLLLAIEGEDLIAAGSRQWPGIFKITAVAAVFGALTIMTWSVHKTVVERRDLAFEGYKETVRHLREKVRPGDLLLIHADAREGFLLQVAIDGWKDAEWLPLTRFGNTGWPCCARGHIASPGQSSKAAVVEDLAEMAPSGFRGKLWLVYGNRPLHWKYLGLDEGDLWRRTMWERGCPPVTYTDFGNLVVSEMACNPSHK